MFGIILPVFLASMPAMAEKFEVALTTSVQGVRDPRWDKVNAERLHSATGLTVGYSITDTTSIIGGFNTGRAGSRLLIPTEDGEVKEDFGFNIATTLSQYQLGARYRWKWKRRWVPTTTVQFLLGHAVLRMDENIDNDGGEVASRYSATAFGFELGGGMEYTVAFLSKDAVRINVGIEAGYTNLFKLRFKDNESGPDPISIGELNTGGPFLTLSLGSRF